MRNRPTIKDVAREARVSHATVSYILNNNWHADRISEDTKKRVWDAVSALGYQFNPIGRALKRGYTNQVTLLVVNWNLAASHAATAMAVSRAAIERGLELNVHVADSDHNAESFLRRRMLHNSGGLMVLWDSPAVGGSLLEDLAGQGVPIVDLLPGVSDSISLVTADREDAGCIVARHLLSLGHLCVGFIGDTVTRGKTTASKLSGYRRALEEAGAPLDLAMIEDVREYGFLGGYGGFRALLDRNPDVTAVFCINDPIALGAVAAAAEIGLRCPADVSVVGYGASAEGEYWRPALTTVELSADVVAREAIQALIAHRKDPQAGPRRRLVPGKLIVRESTAIAAIRSRLQEA